MAPKSSIRRDGERGQIYRDATGRKSPGLSAIVVLVDVFDNFGHVVLVLAELGGILEDVFFFLPILFRFILGALAAAGTPVIASPSPSGSAARSASSSSSCNGTTSASAADGATARAAFFVFAKDSA